MANLGKFRDQLVRRRNQLAVKLSHVANDRFAMIFAGTSDAGCADCSNEMAAYYTQQIENYDRLIAIVKNALNPTRSKQIH